MGQNVRDQILSCCLPSAHMPTWTCRCSDYCQQVSLPYSSQQWGTFYFRTPHKVQVFGVCCEPHFHEVFFLIDEAEQVGKGAVVVVSLVHAFFHLHGLGERRLMLQADKCIAWAKQKHHHDVVPCLACDHWTA